MPVRAKIVDKDLGWAEMFKRASEIKKAKVKVGVLADSSKGGMHKPGVDLTIAEIAAVLEFGTVDGHIPARPALRSTFDEMHDELTKLGKELMGEVLTGKMELTQALNIMGAKLANGVKLKITSGEGVPPPNAPSTIARKGSARPWVDTGRTVNAFTWAIEKPGESNE